MSGLKTLLTIPIGVTLVSSFGYVARVEGFSMKPTLNFDETSEYVFLNKYKARNHTVERGEIVCLISPKDPNQKLIKRVIGIPGDVVHPNGNRERKVKIPSGHCWVEGDYSENSLDSNTFGPVPIGLLTAKATHVVWPFKRWRSLEKDFKNSVIKTRK